MAWFKRKPAATRKETHKTAPNPHTNPKVRSAGFFSTDVNRLLNGWDTTSSSIDHYLESELREIRARSRRMVRSNPYGKRFITTLKSNVIGPDGVGVQAQTMRFADGKNQLDKLANDAIEAAFKDWGTSHCDYLGRRNWVDMQNLAISCAGQDGEFLFEKIVGKAGGKYGYQLRSIDPELLDVNRNSTTAGGGEIRLGVEYDKTGRIIRYHFRKKNRNGDYSSGEEFAIAADSVIHGYIDEWPDQSRGVPWMHSSLERAKHLEKYDEAAIVNARGAASTMAFIHGEGGDQYEGDEQGEGMYAGATLDTYEAGTIKDIGNKSITQLDPDYPHQMYAEFVKTHLRSIASGLGISYHALSNDLEGVNYSSIRAGVLEDREVFKGLQNWFVRQFIQPVFEEWLSYALMMEVIKIGRARLSRPPQDYMNAHYQPRRWAWVDPQKDGAANKLAIDQRLKSRSQIMREQGDDPESVFREIARDDALMDQYGIAPVDVDALQAEILASEKPSED